MNTTTEPPLTVGTSVRLASAAPVFASDPTAGALGRVIQVGQLKSNSQGADETSYLVRWDAGGEGWEERPALDPLRIGDSLTPTTGPPGARPAAPAPPLAGPARHPASRAGAVLVPLVIFVLQTGALRIARHPSPTSIALALVTVALLVGFILRGRRRAKARSRTPSSPEIGTTDMA